MHNPTNNFSIDNSQAPRQKHRHKTNNKTNKFNSTIYAGLVDDPESYLVRYHYFEKYDPSKEYTHGVFEHDYGYGMHKYKFKMYMFGETVKYIVAQEELDNSEVNKWMKTNSCQCLYHQTAWYNPNRFFICKCCVGCVSSEFGASQKVIDNTRKYYKEHYE